MIKDNVWTTYKCPVGQPVKIVAELATSQSVVSQQQPMSQKSGVRSQRQPEKTNKKQ